MPLVFILHMIGYKAFLPGLEIKGTTFRTWMKVGETYSLEEKPSIGKIGFHFCTSENDVYKYYDKDSAIVTLIEALGDIDTDDNVRFCTNQIKIIMILN